MALTSLDYLSAKKVGVTHHHPIDMRCVASVILGGGEGTRLYPLTLTRCKPAIGFGGRYRLIDVPISNSIHSGCHKIFVLTQFLSSSLHHHIFQTYVQTHRSVNGIEILTAEQKPSHKSWYQGTADAIRKNIDYLLETPVEYFLILSGDQLYNINFNQMYQFAKDTDADLVIASLPVNAKDATRMGIMKVDAHDFVVDFHEKPKDEALLSTLKCPSAVLERVGIDPESQRHFIGSMGIYLFKRKALIDLLKEDDREDFGKHLIPTKVKSGKVAAFLYDGYWEDIGTIESFYQANLALLDPDPVFQLYNEQKPIFSHCYDLPPSRISQTQIKDSFICEGSVIDADEITHSLLGPRSVVGKGSIIRDTYLMGNDYYRSPVPDHRPSNPGIGENCIIKKAIIDKNASLGKGVQLINKQNLTHYDGENIFIRDSIIVVPRGAYIPDGFIL